MLLFSLSGKSRSQAGIIFGVPTPFYHLRLAEDLLSDPRLEAGQSRFLQSFACAFLFGSTAPDVQVVSGQPRQHTHFFYLPVQEGDQPPWQALLSNYPQLTETHRISEEQTAFLAGYLCHLQADWIWVKELFAPAFGPKAGWGTFAQRLILHNALRAYLDARLLPELAPGMDRCLGQVQPDGWLPFVDDQDLLTWRDVLVPQLRPGARGQTVEVFSSRQGISVPELHALVSSNERMQREVFSHLPLQAVQDYYQQVLKENCGMLASYLAAYGNTTAADTTNKPLAPEDDRDQTQANLYGS